MTTDKISKFRTPLHMAEAFVTLFRTRAGMSAESREAGILLKVDETGRYLGFVKSSDGYPIDYYIEEMEAVMWPLLDD